MCVYKSLSAPFGCVGLHQILFTQAVAPMWHCILCKSFQEKLGALPNEQTCTGDSTALFSRDTRNKGFFWRRRRPVSAKIGFQAAIFLIQTVATAPSYMKTSHNNNTQSGRNPGLDMEEKWAILLQEWIAQVPSTWLACIISNSCFPD